jgi:hypothetical protein
MNVFEDSKEEWIQSDLLHQLNLGSPNKTS